MIKAQPDHFRYLRPIDGITDEWHKIGLPDELFENLRADFRDIRIIGVTDVGDTIEAPYILKVLKDKSIEKEVQFKQINNSKKSGAYFYTFEIPENETINEIVLDFGNKNFDWKVKLEGSHDQGEWFDLLEDYRLVAIENSQTHYSFTTLILPPTSYRFLRLKINSNTVPRLRGASIHHHEMVKGKRRLYHEKALKTHEDSNKTILDISLERTVPVSAIKMEMAVNYDYYRPITIQYLSDSFETEKGWKYRYTTLKQATLSSFENNEFNFAGSTLKQLRIIIENHDNEPLEIEDCQLWDYERVLIARFTEKANYFMYYSSSKARKPIYDLNYFTDQIPEQLSAVSLGDEQEVMLDATHVKKPLFENKVWLWAVMLAIIALLAYFSMQMMKKR